MEIGKKSLAKLYLIVILASFSLSLFYFLELEQAKGEPTYSETSEEETLVEVSKAILPNDTYEVAFAPEHQLLNLNFETSTTNTKIQQNLSVSMGYYFPKNLMNWDSVIYGLFEDNENKVLSINNLTLASSVSDFAKTSPVNIENYQNIFISFDTKIDFMFPPEDYMEIMVAFYNKDLISPIQTQAIDYNNTHIFMERAIGIEASANYFDMLNPWKRIEIAIKLDEDLLKDISTMSVIFVPNPNSELPQPEGRVLIDNVRIYGK